MPKLPAGQSRRYEYSAIGGWLPTARAAFMLAFLFLGATFTLGGAAGLDAHWVLVPIATLIVTAVLEATPFIRRRHGMRKSG